MVQLKCLYRNAIGTRPQLGSSLKVSTYRSSHIEYKSRDKYTYPTEIRGERRLRVQCARGNFVSGAVFAAPHSLHRMLLDCPLSVGLQCWPSFRISHFRFRLRQGVSEPPISLRTSSRPAVACQDCCIVCGSHARRRTAMGELRRCLCTESAAISTCVEALQSWLLIDGNDTKSVSKASRVSCPACEGTWRSMNLTLTAVSSPGHTQHVHPYAPTKTASPLTFVLHLPCTLTLAATPPEQVSTV